ncbi:Mobile element protein [Methylorubrum populi]|uniref:Mobile element protein n=1 Tax=Methylorubrum populi TaxID=223967 RepID=A0A833MW80_9HYPH|nr:Mobile element protein [Methylorubrum populi]
MRRQHSDYAPKQSREQEPSTPSIEQIFAKLKGLLQTAAARTVPDLWDAIRRVFSRFTPDECRNCLAAAGYDNDLAVAT